MSEVQACHMYTNVRNQKIRYHVLAQIVCMYEDVYVCMYAYAQIQADTLYMHAYTYTQAMTLEKNVQTLLESALEEVTE